MESKILTIKSGISGGQTTIFTADCEVSYAGKAETLLERGERLIIIKQDGTILVHQPEGNNPINYMKAGTETSLEYEGEAAILRGTHISHGDDIEIKIFEIHFAEAIRLKDGEKIQLTGNERDMSDMIYGNPSLVEEGLTPVNTEEQTKYGFIDVFCTDKDNCLVVIECKKFKADLSAVTQLRRYVEKLKEAKGIDNVRGILAAPHITSNAKTMLEDWGFSFAAVDPPIYKERLKKEQARLTDF